MNKLRISLLHLALKPGALSFNYELVERAIRVAATSGADWVIAPELCISGYQFIDLIGTDWIAVHPDQWTNDICQLAKSLKLVILFGHVERDAIGKFYNCGIMVDARGAIIGHHRKVNTHAEPWASPGRVVELVNWKGIDIGMLICADAYAKEIACTLRSKGAQLLVSPAAWDPRPQRSRRRMGTANGRDRTAFYSLQSNWNRADTEVLRRREPCHQEWSAVAVA